MAIQPGRPGYKYLVSACLAGTSCKYDGTNSLKPSIKSLVVNGNALPVCPEVLGSMTTPRERCEIAGGDGASVLKRSAKVITVSGRDVSSKYIKGAKKVLRLAKKYNIQKAILKSGSPACGLGFIYDGTFTHVHRRGDGVLAALLKSSGIKICTEKSKNC